MKSYRLAILALSLSICAMPSAWALKNGDTRTEVSRTINRGTNSGSTGYWVESLRKTYQFSEDPAKAAVRDAFAALFGREANDQEWAAWLAAFQGKPAADITAKGKSISDLYKNIFGRAPSSEELIAGIQRLYNGDTLSAIAKEMLNKRLAGSDYQALDPNVLAAVKDRIANGSLSADVAIAQLNALLALSKENPNSKYPSNLPSAFLTSTGAISADVANQVGAWGRGVGVDTKIANAYKALGIDPKEKTMPNGGTLDPKFPTMIAQLKAAGMVTYDWDFNTLMKDLDRSVIDQMGSARAGITNSTGYNGDQSNLFSKDNLNDPTLQHDYNAGLGSVVTDDGTVRGWIKTYDGLSAFNNTNDIDLYMAVTYSSAAKLVAESKALRALGLTSQADTKLTAARNIVLLTGNNHDPLVLDLNHNGKIDVTGLSSAKGRSDATNRFVKEGSVKFDLLANGQPSQIEWIKGGDAFLVDNRKDQAIAAIAAGKNLTGANLFGDVEGYPGGFLKLGMGFDKEAKFAANEKIRLSSDFGAIKGEELNNLMVWIDNGDGIATRNELKTLKDLDITEISVRPVYKKENGELLEQAYFIQNGQKYLIQEVWFRSEK